MFSSIVAGYSPFVSISCEAVKPLASSQHSVRVCVWEAVCVWVFFPSLQMMEAQGSPCFSAFSSLVMWCGLLQHHTWASVNSPHILKNVSRIPEMYILIMSSYKNITYNRCRYINELLTINSCVDKWKNNNNTWRQIKWNVLKSQELPGVKTDDWDSRGSSANLIWWKVWNNHTLFSLVNLFTVSSAEQETPNMLT